MYNFSDNTAKVHGIKKAQKTSITALPWTPKNKKILAYVRGITYTKKEHGIPAPGPGPVQEVNPSPEWKTAAGLVCNIFPHSVHRLYFNNTKYV